MIEGIKEKNSGEVPEGVIIEITGALVDMYTTDCHDGLMSVLEQYPQLTVEQAKATGTTTIPMPAAVTCWPATATR